MSLRSCCQAATLSPIYNIDYDPEQFIVSGSTLVEYIGKGGDVVVPNDITVIGDSAFAGAAEVTSITFPRSVTKVEAYAFEGCTGLTGKFTPPNNLNYIEDYAFKDCTGITEIAFENKLYSFGEHIFEGCTGLQKVELPEKFIENNAVTILPPYTFSGCTSLTDVTIFKEAQLIGDRAFENCSALTTVNIPDKVKELGKDVFAGCTALETINFSKVLYLVGGGSFNDTPWLKAKIEETKNKTLGITDNSDKKVSDEEIYNKISTESDLYKEWTKIGNNHIFKDYNKNNADVHSGNYTKVGQGEFLIYKGKNYFENKKEDTETKSLPPEFVNWLQSELRKLKNAYSLKKKEPEIKDEYTFKLNDQNTESEISTKRRKRIRKEIPKKRLNNKRLKTIKKPEEIEIKDEETMPLPISRSESSESSRSVNNQNSLRYMFQEIQKLKNLPPEEYTKKVNSLLDFQLDNAIVMVHRKHADRINRFIHNLEDFRKSRANYQKYKSRKLSYLPPISIKKVNSENIFNLKKNYLSEEKVKATDNILVPKNKTKNIIEKMKL